MASARSPEQIHDLVAHHLPPELPRTGPRGGRPWVAHVVVVRVIWYVLATGVRWADVPPELWVLRAGRHRRLRAWEEAGIWDRLHADLPRLLRQAGKLDMDLVVIDSVYVRAFGAGEGTGPSPVDRRKPGTKHALMVRQSGVPLEIRTAVANASDRTQIIPLVIDFPTVGGRRGRPKELPDDVYADRGTTARRRGRSRSGGASSCTSGGGGRPQERAGEGPLGGRADQQLGQGAPPDAGPVRPPGGHPGRLRHTRRLRHLPRILVHDIL